jgi:hypothetical protein
MTRSLKIYQGEDQTPVTDLTEPTVTPHVKWEEVEAGHRAYQLESTSSSFPMRDEEGETGNELNLPGGLTRVSLAAHNRLIWEDGDGVVLFRGRVGPKDYSRGAQKASRAREVTVNAQDINFDLRGIIVDGWTRPSETDVARVQALVADYLSGSPRVTTDISTTYVAAGSNTITLPALRYDSTDPETILRDISTQANKLAFVTVDNELFYDGNDSTAYQAGIRISDVHTEWDTEGSCVSSGDSFLGSESSNEDEAFFSDHPAWSGIEEERVELILTSGVAAGDTIIAVTAWNRTHALTITVYDEKGNTWTLDDEHENTSSSLDDTIQFWRCNVTNALEAGDYIRYAAQLGGDAFAGRCIGAWAYAGTYDFDTGGTGAGTISGTVACTAPAGDLVIAATSISATTTPTLSGDNDWDAMIPKEGVNGSAEGGKYIYAQQLRDQGGTNGWTVSLTPNRDWAALGVSYSLTDSGDGGDLATFPPIWDVGPSSTEDGLQLLSGLRLYYGPEDDQYVYVSSPTTANQYSLYEESLHTTDPSITTVAQATVLANSILARRKYEERTYNVSIGPLNEEQIACIKPGQLINIKARAIPDADDQYVSRRIAQLKWTTPIPGMFFAHMQLDRPIKDVPHSVGNKSAHEAIGQHVLNGSNSHPEFIPRAVLTTQGDMLYRGASDVTRLAIGSSNTHLISDGVIPRWVANSSGGSHADSDHTAFLTKVGGAKHTRQDHGSMGATETIDLGNGNAHIGTLDANCVLTFSGSTSGTLCELRLYLVQDGTGNRTVTWPAAVVWPDDVPPVLSTDAAAVDSFYFETLDGGTTWYGYYPGASTSGSTANLIPVDTGTVTYDDTDPGAVGTTVETVWGYDGGVYYESTGAADGEEAALYWDPDDGVYCIVTFDF